MVNIAFTDDASSRKVTRFLFWLEIGAMIVVLGLILLQAYSLAFFLSFLTLLAFLAILAWLYFRYQRHPLVKEKNQLNRQALELENQVRAASQRIQAAQQKQEELKQAEQKELEVTLLTLQKTYIEKGLASHLIKDASIPGIGPKLKERLAEHHVLSAAQVNERVAQIPGMGKAKQLVLHSWRNIVNVRLNATKPARLSDEERAEINRKYQSLHAQSVAAQEEAEREQKSLSAELNSIQPRLKQLMPLTFIAYLSKSLASRGFMAVTLASLMLIGQLVSSVSATTSSLIASIPTATGTATSTLTPTVTFTPTIPFTPTITDTPTITFTPTITSTPTITNTPTATFTPLPTRTPLPTQTPIRPPTLAPAAGPCSCGGNLYNCSKADFSSKGAAQGCYNYCVSIGAGDVHSLDSDGDGLACESGLK